MLKRESTEPSPGMTSKTIAESGWKSACTNDEVGSSAAIRLAVCSGQAQRGYQNSKVSHCSSNYLLRLTRTKFVASGPNRSSTADCVLLSGLLLKKAFVAGRDSRGTPQSPTITKRLAAACALCGRGKSWHRTWVPRLWDQRSQSDDLL